MEEKGGNEGMIGGLRGVGSAGRKRRGICGCNEAGPPFTPDDLVRGGLIGGVAESRRTTPSVSLQGLINRCSSYIRPSTDAQLMW